MTGPNNIRRRSVHLIAEFGRKNQMNESSFQTLLLFFFPWELASSQSYVLICSSRLQVLLMWAPLMETYRCLHHTWAVQRQVPCMEFYGCLETAGDRCAVLLNSKSCPTGGSHILQYHYTSNKGNVLSLFPLPYTFI